MRNTRFNKAWIEMLNVPELTVPIEEELSRLLFPEDTAYEMSKRNKADAIITLQSKHIRELKESGLIWEFSFLEMENLLKELFTLQGTS